MHLALRRSLILVIQLLSRLALKESDIDKKREPFQSCYGVSIPCVWLTTFCCDEKNLDANSRAWRKLVKSAYEYERVDCDERGRFGGDEAADSQVNSPAEDLGAKR